MSDYDQTKGELCLKCGWAMKFPEEPCRCELERENAALRSLLREAITDYVDPYDLPETEDYVLRVKAALAEAKP